MLSPVRWRRWLALLSPAAQRPRAADEPSPERPWVGWYRTFAGFPAHRGSRWQATWRSVLPPPGDRIPLALLTGAFVAAAASFAVAVPLFQGPDEPAHVDMIRYRARHLRALPGPELRISSGIQQAVDQVGLPQGGPIPWNAPPRDRPVYRSFDEYPGASGAARSCPSWNRTTCQNYHYAHPPTSYLLLSLPDRLLRGLGFPTEVLVLRLMCALVTTPLVPLTYLTARQVWAASSARPLAAATAVATFAPLAAAGASVNNDCLMLLVAGCVAAAGARMLAAPSPRAATALGLALGAGLLVKSEFQALAIASALIVLVGLTALPRRLWLPSILGFSAPALVGSVWWLRNLIRFHSLAQPGSEILAPSNPGPWRSASFLQYAGDHVGEVVGRFWGLYGPTAVALPAPWPIALTVGAGALAVGGTVAWAALRRGDRPLSASCLRLGALGLIPASLLAGVLLVSFVVYQSNGEVRGLAGRYLYPSLPVLAIGAVAALAALTRVRGPSQAALFALGTLLAAGGWIASFARAIHGLYGTRSLSLLLDRAHGVSAVPAVGVWLALLLAVWSACLTGAAYKAVRLLQARRAASGERGAADSERAATELGRGAVTTGRGGLPA